MPNVRFETKVDGFKLSGKVNRLVFEDHTYGYHFLIETPNEHEGVSDAFAYMTLKDELLNDLAEEGVLNRFDLTFPFDHCETELPDDAWDCGAVTASDIQY